METLQEKQNSEDESQSSEDEVPELPAIPVAAPTNSKIKTPTSAPPPKSGGRRNSILRKFSIGNIGIFQQKVSPEEQEVVTLREIQRARNRVIDYIHQTELITSSNLNSMLRLKVLFKAESFQKSGTYRIRGLLNHIIQLKEQQVQKRSKTRKSSLPQNFGVMTYRAGEFAEAAACAASMLALRSACIVPKSTCKTTLEILKHYKATVMINPSDSRGTLLRRAEKEAQDTAFRIVHPYEPAVIAGYGTLAMDFMKQMNNLVDVVIVYAGDGCLSSATAIVVKQTNPSTDVYLVTQPGDPLIVSMATATFPEDQCAERAAQSIAPALNLSVHPSTRSALIKHCEKCILTVDNNAIIDAMKFMFERMKVVVDENAAACVAALFSETFLMLCQSKGYQRVGIMLTGGNTDLENIPFAHRGVFDNTKCRNT